MLLDSQGIFSNAQAITATAVSTNVVKMVGEVSFGTDIDLSIEIVEDFNNLTSLNVDVQTATDSAFTSPVTLQSASLLLAALKKSKFFPINAIPKGNLGYIRLNYTVTGTAPTTGKITAGVVAALDQGYQDV